jgi:nitroreductase
MILTAQNEGFGICCVGSFEKEVRESVAAPNNSEILLLLAVGCPKRLDMATKLVHRARSKKKLPNLQRRNLRQTLRTAEKTLPLN